MSRSGYSDDYDGNDDQWAQIRWRGAVESSIRGRRGQALLRELLEALDAMPEKRLIADDLITPSGEVCALGALGVKRGIADDLKTKDPWDYPNLANIFGVAAPLIQEIEWMNDEGVWGATPEQRWLNMRAWVAGRIAK